MSSGTIAPAIAEGAVTRTSFVGFAGAVLSEQDDTTNHSKTRAVAETRFLLRCDMTFLPRLQPLTVDGYRLCQTQAWRFLRSPNKENGPTALALRLPSSPASSATSPDKKKGPER